MTIVWIIVGAVLGNLCWWGSFYVFAIRPNDNTMTSTTKAGVSAFVALFVICGVWYALFPDIRV